MPFNTCAKRGNRFIRTTDNVTSRSTSATSIYHSVRLSVCLSVDRSVSLSVCLPTYMFVYLQTSYLFSYYLLLIVKFPSTWTDDQTKETSGQCAGRSAVITVSPARVRRRRGRRRAQTTTDHKQAGRGAAKS